MLSLLTPQFYGKESWLTTTFILGVRSDKWALKQSPSPCPRERVHLRNRGFNMKTHETWDVAISGFLLDVSVIPALVQGSIYSPRVRWVGPKKLSS